MDSSSRWFLIFAVFIWCGSVQDVFSIGHQSGRTDWTPQRSGDLARNSTTVECLSNQFFNGIECVCLPGFTGDICQYLDSIVTDELNRTVEVQMVLNEDYKDAYNDSASTEYKQFVHNFEITMLAFYLRNNISDVKDIVVTRISPEQPIVRMSETDLELVKVSEEAINPRADGLDISVTHRVILGLPNKAGAEEMYKEDFNAVTSAVKLFVGCVEISEACPFNVSGFPTCERIPITMEDVCEVPSYLTDHYAAVNKTNGEFACVTVCDPDHPNTQHCYNEGKCSYHWTVGRLCKCPNSNSIWYMYDDCRYPINSFPFYIGLTAVLLLLVLLISALIACAVTRKGKQSKTKDVKEKLANQWLDEDFTMSRPNSAAFFTVDSREPASLYQARPSPLNPPPRTPLPHESWNRINPPEENPYQQMRINRPQIVGLRDN